MFLGITGNICLTLLFFPVARGSSVLPLFGLTSESTIKYHIWLGHLVMVLFTAHGVCYIIYWIVTNQASEVLSFLFSFLIRPTVMNFCSSSYVYSSFSFLFRIPKSFSFCFYIFFLRDKKFRRHFVRYCLY